MREKRKIVIVDDELEFAKVVKLRLENVGYKAIIALDTYLGMQNIVRNEPDLVILDLLMPAGGGFTLLDRIRNHPTTVNIPVVILTGKEVDDELRTKAYEYDVTEIVQKPYDPAKFVEKIMWMVPA